MSYALRYYASSLEGTERKVYFEIESCLASLSRLARLPRISYQRISEIYTMVKYDHPDYFYAGMPSYRAVPKADHVEMIPDYYFDLRDIPSLREGIAKRLQRVVAPAVQGSDTEKLRFVWDFVRDGVTYEKLTRNYSHEIYGVLHHGIGVCEGIAKTVKAMLDRLSVESLVVLSDVGPEGTRHAWNVIWLYGRPRHYDFTFDLTRHKDGKRPIYQGLTDEQILRDHRPSVFPIPNCN